MFIPTRIGTRELASKAAATRHCQTILHAPPLRSPVVNPDWKAFLFALFACHPANAAKVAGRTVIGFEVHPNEGGTCCYYATFAEGGMVSFSYKPCIEGGTAPMHRIAARTRAETTLDAPPYESS
jgi:hypothetical protein